MSRNEVTLEPKDQRIPKTFWAYLAAMGPGLFIMAFHLGPGDVSTHSLIGSLYGMELVWALALAVILLAFFTEMIGRYAAVTNKSIFDGFRSVGNWAAWVMFIGMLGVYGTFGSATSLAAGLGVEAVLPFPGVDFLVGVRIWGTIFLFVCFILVWINAYKRLEAIIKALVVFMTISFLATVVYAGFDWRAFLAGFVPPYIPKGAAWLTITEISVVVGGVTSITYAYAVQANGWTKPAWVKTIRFDVWASFILLFIIDTFILMAGYKVLLPKQIVPQTALDMAMALEPLYGPGAKYIFSLGLWGAAITTLFGAFLGSYGFLDFLRPAEYHKGEEEFRKGPWSKRMFVLTLVLCGMFIWVYLGPPLFMMMFLYISGALWMPAMAIVLVSLTNNRELMGQYANGKALRVVGAILIGLSFVAALTGLLSVFGVITGPA